ncbi:D-lactate dehydrogenase (cytochrome) [Strigomonas culicis]|uniref:D-lactate dehydrogenase (cytochrome) n=1 Tax=Strigomonas culicis TaxID=28005 RepID=S9TYS2_9TRYP|nr:D-lactate dehydrogenase (cytochrome) [Strigomonas culicis]|eukprot:EPY23657.1 D-lactate dehydrogenase (cytochrome) [Strigomonas culicis]
MTSKTRSGKSEFEVAPFAARQAQYKACLDEIAALHKWGKKEFITDQVELRKNYSIDKSSHIPAVPAAAVAPSTAELVAKIVQICAKHKVPMTPRGAGTGLEGGAVPYAGGIVIDTNNLKWIKIDKENSCVWVGAGVRKTALNRAVQKEGLLFGADPSSNPCVGGMVSTSGSGMCTLKYGTTRENVLSLRVVTPQGELFQTRQVVRKSSAGLELTALYIGSEGTLGIITEVCFRLFPDTKYRAGGVATFTTTEDAVKAVVAMKQQGVPHTLLRCELLNKGAVAGSNKVYKTQLEETATVLLEFVTNDPSRRDLYKDYQTVVKVFKQHGKTRKMRYLKDGKEMDSVWDARRGCHYSSMKCDKAKGTQQVISTDVCVPLTALAQAVSDTEEDFVKNNRPCFICAHISDGNYHTLIPYSDPADFVKARALEQAMVRRAVKMGGTVSGEHGVGVGKVHHLLSEHGEVHLNTQESIKKALDPDNIMNPGCFYPCQQKLLPTAHL